MARSVHVARLVSVSLVALALAPLIAEPAAALPLVRTLTIQGETIVTQQGTWE